MARYRLDSPDSFDEMMETLPRWSTITSVRAHEVDELRRLADCAGWVVRIDEIDRARPLADLTRNRGKIVLEPFVQWNADHHAAGGRDGMHRRSIAQPGSE